MSTSKAIVPISLRPRLRIVVLQLDRRPSLYMVRAPSRNTKNMDLIERRHRAIRVWLYAVAALSFGMVLVGGATRLTEAGVWIVEWKPVTGAVPRLSEGAWAAEFDKYKTIPQF